ncbi:hypothetical protein Raf01_15560 [Rugosimonospora africana]|uniref:Tyr recombinase domain-containing protein n=1 Tax=Rugosimonospora africana TaxID=556532 RepID=A0A8J3QNK8_9ACTN|nr:hypothetical protein Raf01_15560 [Rugosimonospora africana]
MYPYQRPPPDASHTGVELAEPSPRNVRSAKNWSPLGSSRNATAPSVREDLIHRNVAKLVQIGGPFYEVTGSAIEPDNLRRSWYPLRAVIDLPEMRLHNLRHSCAALLLDTAG